MITAYLGLGSNLGDKVGYIQQAHMMLKDTEGIEVEASSSLYESEPYGNKQQDWFINAVLKVNTIHSPERLLTLSQRIEDKLGRERSADTKWGPRTIDIDILFYNNELVSTNHLQIPHYEVHSRAFVLVPLMELSPDLIHPVMNKSIIELHNELLEPEKVFLYGTKTSEI